MLMHKPSRPTGTGQQLRDGRFISLSLYIQRVYHHAACFPAPFVPFPSSPSSFFFELSSHLAMMFQFSLVLSLLARCLNAQNIINGQIFTPGIAIVDAPQPNTPLGGGMFLFLRGSMQFADLQRYVAGSSRRFFRRATPAPTIPCESRLCDTQHYHLPLELHDGQEFHGFEWHCELWECEFRGDYAAGAWEHRQTCKLGMAGLFGWEWRPNWV